MPEIRKLKNGITLVLSEDNSTEAVSLIIYIGAGSRYEDERQVGITHFLEHILFDGTKKRPTSLDITKEIDILGASVNASPMEEYTTFYSKSAAEHLDRIADIFSDMLLNSKLNEKDIEREKKVIIEEIKMRTDIASSHVFDIFDQAIFSGSSLGRYAGGTVETITSISRSDLIKFYKEYYRGKNVYISVCGNFGGKSSDEISKLIEQKFIFPPQEAKIVKSLDFKQERLKFLAKNSQQTNLCLGYYGCPYGSADRLPLKILAIILGGNMSSRMFDEIREKRGLAYDVRTFSASISDVGTLLTIAGVADEKAGEALKAILTEYEKIKAGITDAELSKAKSFLLGQMKIAFEDSRELGEFYLSQVFNTGRIETLSEISTKIAKISARDIKKIANKYINSQKLSVAVIAKESVESEVEKVIKSIN